MSITVNLDQDLLDQAERVTGISEPAELIRAGLITLVHYGAAGRLARLGGTDPSASAPPRRRSAQS